MTAKKKNRDCMVCGSALEYLNHTEEFSCSFCGSAGPAHIKCPKGHVVCEACHGKEALVMIEDLVFSTSLTDPVEIAELAMNHPALPVLGCEHAYIAAGSLLAALRNSRYSKIADHDIREAFARIKQQALSGYCGLTGICGVAPAIGAAFSVFLGARCGSDREQKITMEVVQAVMKRLADLTGPSCCKAYVRAVLPLAAAEFATRFGIVLPVSGEAIACRYSAAHPHGCREDACPYFLREATKDIFTEAINLRKTACLT